MTGETSGEQQPKEIERKFLLEHPGEVLNGVEGKKIRQGYTSIGEDGSETRIRDKDGSYTLTVKTNGDLVRGEWETPITKEQFDTLWPSTEERRVEKTRYAVPLGDATVEVDVFEGKHQGLVLAEVEFPDELSATLFEEPAWMGEDVTSNAGFKNQNLATSPF